MEKYLWDNNLDVFPSRRGLIRILFYFLIGMFVFGAIGITEGNRWQFLWWQQNRFSWI